VRLGEKMFADYHIFGDEYTGKKKPNSNIETKIKNKQQTQEIKFSS
jgi:hypothetical protein